ncbi:MAG: Ig-like domain-containing protein, partial [Lachnospiraceae bacterium]|nr:Ig-like domain-containing protein [Lachnospiraceae bacterium]
TGNDQGKAQYGSWRGDWFNWAVAQAAPLRRVYSERPVAYDWNYGWASGGYVADCLIKGIDVEGNSAGTWSGQQFFTRNSEITGNTFGTTLNNFFMGVQAANNLTGETGKPLRNGNGYTNWGIKGATSKDDQVGAQQVVTEITNTPKISEKPFLYLDDDGEYKVFVPAVRENASGISWGEGKANDGMGEGTSLSLSMFYIAKPTDTAAEINRQIADGKNIYFTPGTYHAETPIVVNRENTILLGTGMASIIPDNGEMALRVEDKSGIRIEGLIFDAGASSKLLLQVGTKGTHTNHADNPIILQDLFFRVGGTTDVLTKADDAMEINSDDVICDHFWIWRADHGAGVEWYGNESKHGLIVNGDRVRCYALFNEHFQEYHTLWNGEDGETYFYQNETCYDPVSQEAWMSHNGTVKGYSSYKVSNDVERHYAVGLGVYNVFIYTGKTYDGKGIGIQLDNAIEVPNKPDVMVENACTQTFANDEKEGGGFYPLSSINHIINGIGGIVSSGMSEDLVRGEGWSRKFVLYYHNGEAEYGKEPDRNTFVYDNDEAKKPYDQRGKFVGTEVVTVEAPADEEIDLDRISKLYNQFSDKTEDDYTANSWKRADMANVLQDTKAAIDKGKLIQAEMAAGKKYSQAEISALQTQINKARTTLEAASEKLVYIGSAVWQRDKYRDYKKDNYTQDSWNAFEQARINLNQVLNKANQADPSTIKDVYLLQTEIDEACEALETAASKLTPVTTIAVTGVALNRESLSIRKGNTFQLMAVMQPADATNQKVEWSSSEEKTVSVDQTGKITALEDGTAEITVKTEDGAFTAVCRVSVTVEKEDKTDSLKYLIAEAEALKEANYTAESWKAFAAALNKAKEVVAKQDVTQEELDNAFKDLMEARDALVLKSGDLEAPVDKDQLRELISQCESLNRNDYTKESWETFATALADAKETAADVNVAQEDVEEAIKKLTQALEQLMDREGLWAVDIADITYTGKAIKPAVTVYNGKTLLSQGKDYTVSYKNNTKVTENAQVVIKGKGNYGGSFTKIFKIVPKNLEEEDILIPDLYVKAPKAGKSVAPAPVVTRNGKKLSKKEYTVGIIKDKDGNPIEKITASGVYTVEVSGVSTNGYTGIREIHMTVAESDQVLMSAVKVTGIQNVPYTGSIVEPVFTVKYGKDTLIPGEDYQVICNSREVGAATAVIIGTGTKYVGEKTIAFKITGTTLKAKDVTLDTTEAVYTGSAIEPNVTVKDAEPDRDYTVQYDKNVKTGKAVVTVRGVGKYTGTVKKNFKISAFDIKENEDGKLSYNKEALTAPYAKGGSKLTASDLNITFNDVNLAEGVDYTLVYASNKKTGTATVKIKGKGNFKGITEPVSFTVLQQELSNLTDLSAADVLEKNAKKYDRVVPVIKDLDGKALKKGTDFVVTGYTKTDGTAYEETPAVGDTIRVTVEGVNGSNYKGTTHADFRVIENNKNISKATVKINAQSYTGKAIELSETDPVSGEQQIFVTMKVNGETRTLTEGTDYEIVKSGYSKNINKGTGRLIIRGINEYGGTKTVSFKINSYILTHIEWYEDLYSRAMSWFLK